MGQPRYSANRLGMCDPLSYLWASLSGCPSCPCASPHLWKRGPTGSLLFSTIIVFSLLSAGLHLAREHARGESQVHSRRAWTSRLDEDLFGSVVAFAPALS